MKPYTQLSVLTVFLASFSVVLAGNLESPADPSEDDSRMYTLDNIYNRLNNGTQADEPSGGFAEPTSGPTAGTGHTLNQVYQLADEKMGVPKTGQTKCYNEGGGEISCGGTGQDGDHQKGTFASPRFTANVDNNGDGDCDDDREWCDGTVTENLTGLIWLKNAGCFSGGSWSQALSYAYNLADFVCGLMNGSTPGDWRLPNIKELQSLIDFSNAGPALPSGHPFSDVQFDYWSSTTHTVSPSNAWRVFLSDGYVSNNHKSGISDVWPVQGGR